MTKRALKQIRSVAASRTMTERDPDRVEAPADRIDDRIVAPQPQSSVSIVERPPVPSSIVDERAGRVGGYRPCSEQSRTRPRARGGC